MFGFITALVIGLIAMAIFIHPQISNKPILIIPSGTQGQWKDLSIGVGSILEEDYVDASGAKHHGPTALILFSLTGQPSKDMSVYTGEQLSVGIHTVKVTRITVGSNDNGAPGSNNSSVALEITD